MREENEQLLSRIRDKKDKASVENTVSHVATWVTAGLRKEMFTSLVQLRARIGVQIAGFYWCASIGYHVVEAGSFCRSDSAR